jgi:DNA-binding MarR family transcriptional regulator
MPPRSRKPSPIAKLKRSKPTSATDRAVVLRKSIDLWTRERPDLDGPTQQIRAGMLFLSTYMLREHDEIAAKFGITGAELRILFRLRSVGPPFVLRPTDLFEALFAPSGTMTRQLDKLLSLGFVVRSRDEVVDRRSVAVRLTDKGQKAANRALTEAIEKSAVSAAIGRLAKHDRNALRDLLKGMLDNFTDALP